MTTIDVQITGSWSRMSAPTPETPYWHEDDGSRKSFGEVAGGAGNPQIQEQVRVAHAQAIADLVMAAFAARDRGDTAESRRLSTAASRLCNECAGLWPVSVAARA